MGSGLGQRDGVMEFRSGLMEQNIKGIGLTIRPVEKENSPIFMAMFMKVIGRMTKPVGLAFTPIQKLMPVTKDIGKMICSTVLEFKSMQMEIDTKECSTKEKDMERGNISFPMALCTADSGFMEGSRAKGSASGQMAKNMMENGFTTRNTGMESTHGKMAGNTKASIKMIKSMGLGRILGQMADSMWVNGKMTRGMVKASI